MQKHYPFSWIKNKYGAFLQITSVAGAIHLSGTSAGFDFEEAFDKFSFMDGTPFGVKE